MFRKIGDVAKALGNRDVAKAKDTVDTTTPPM